MSEKYYLLGLFAGDGWFVTRGISIGTNSIEFAKQIAKISEKVFSKSSIKRRKYNDGHILFIVSVWKKSVEDEFSKLLRTKKNKSKTFKPPRMSMQEKRFFLAGIFDAEASSYIWRDKPRIGMEIHNKIAAEFIFSTLRKDDIKCYLSNCKGNAFKIDFTGKDHVNRFFNLYPVKRLIPSSCTGKSTL